MSGWKRALRVVPVVAIVALAGGLVARQKLAPKPVTTAPVVRGVAVQAIYATGSVEAEDRVVVKAKTSGSIAEIVVREGALVKRGDLLARIDNPFATLELERGKVDLAAASRQAKSAPAVAALVSQSEGLAAELEVARRNLARATELASTGALARTELDAAGARVRQLEAQLAANRSQQLAARIDLDANAARQAAVVATLGSRVADTEVRAPQDGVVLARNVEPGEVVSVNQPLFRVGDTSRLVLEVLVDEADVAKVRDGRDGGPASVAGVSLYAYPAQTFEATVFEVLPDANRERKAYLAKLRLTAPPPNLRAGMSAEVNVVVDKRPDALLVPAEAEQEGAVWIVESGRARRREVVVGLRDLLRFEAKSGLAEGDRVVTVGQKTLSEGARVEATERPLDALAPMPDASKPQGANLR